MNMRYVLKYIDGLWQRYENDKMNFCHDVMHQLGLVSNFTYRLSVRTTPKKTHIKVKMTPITEREDGSHLWQWHIDNIESSLPPYLGSSDQDRLLDKLFPNATKGNPCYIWIRLVKIS
jgi:hypothetical protein